MEGFRGAGILVCVSALDGFMTTWTSARQTYGQGTPQGGAGFDQSDTLTRLQSATQSAAPGSRWTGTAANAYGAVNSKHGEVLGQLATLDQRLAAEVDNSAQATAAGRQRLDALRQWVAAAEANVPAGRAGDQMRTAIAANGLKQLQEILRQTDSESSAIGGRIRKLGDEYKLLGDKVFKAGGGDVQALTDEEEKKAEEEAERKAHDDVEKTLKDGDKDAAGRVESVLKGIKPYQELTAEQSAYLSEMQSQQHDMSVKDLKSAEERLGDKGHVVGDSWQLLSNDDVPRSAGKFDEQQKGGFDRLPQSVQDAVKSPGVFGDQQMKDIAAIVKDGNPALQQGTELDREMIRKADRMMDAPLFADYTGQPGDGSRPQYDVVVQDIFDSAGRDHQIVHDQLTGNHGDDGQDFLHDITHHEWNDDGKAAGGLFEWTKDSTGPEGQIAGESAYVYADYLGTHSGELLAIDGNHQIGDVNPELVKSFAHGLEPYQEELVTDQPRVDTAFHRLDELSGDMTKTKGLFAVIDSQHDAAVDWNKAAYHNALDMQQSFAAFAKDHPDLPAGDVRVDDLQSSARLLGVIDGGMSQETLSNVNNAEMTNQQANDAAKDSYEFKKDILRSVFSYAPPGDLVNNAFADMLAGPPPELGDVKINDKTGMVTDVGLTSSEQSIGYQNTQAHYAVASQFVHQGNVHIEPRFFDTAGNLLPPNQIAPADWSLYDMQLSTSMAEYTQIGPTLQKFNTTLGQIGGYHG